MLGGFGSTIETSIVVRLPLPGAGHTEHCRSAPRCLEDY